MPPMVRPTRQPTEWVLLAAACGLCLWLAQTPLGASALSAAAPTSAAVTRAVPQWPAPIQRSRRLGAPTRGGPSAMSQDTLGPGATARRRSDESRGRWLTSPAVWLATLAAAALAALGRSRRLPRRLPGAIRGEPAAPGIWRLAAAAAEDDKKVVVVDAPQDGDSPTGGYTTSEDGVEEVKEDPIYGSMSASDEVRMAVINEVRRQFHRTVEPLTNQLDGSAAPPPTATDERLTHSALLMTRMMRIIGQKAADLVELQDLPSDNLTTEESLKYFCQPSSAKLRALLANETTRASDLFFKQNVIAARKEIRQSLAPQLLAVGGLQLPFLLPAKGGLPRPVLVKPDLLLDAIAPELTPEELAYAYALEQLAATVYGTELAEFLAGKTASHPSTFIQQVLAIVNATMASGAAEMSNVLRPQFLDNIRKRVKETEVGELGFALRSLSEAERKILRDWVLDVLDKGWQILLRRIAHLGVE